MGLSRVPGRYSEQPGGGIHSFYVPRSHPKDIDGNVHCLDQDTLPHLEVEPFNGKEWDENIEHLPSIQT